MDNFVPISDVLQVLHAKAVTVSVLDRVKGHYLLAGNGELEVRILAPQIPKPELAIYLASLESTFTFSGTQIC